MLISEMRAEAFDFTKGHTFSAVGRHNLVTLDSLLAPEAPYEHYDNPELPELAERILAARAKGRPVILFYGAHVIKQGLSKILLAMVERGFVTHIAGNGAGSIHDFELACLGGTSEHVPTAIEDGSFGMWEETGRLMNTALKEGTERGFGYGQSLAVYVEEHPELFPNRDICVFYNTWRMGALSTFHPAIGTDIIDEHPIADFGVKGLAGGRDFGIFCNSVKDLKDGVFLNFGSAVQGPEVFLKCLACSRNQGYDISNLTTANFDLLELGDYKSPVGKDNYHYYYRPRKNIVNRPVSLGGRGFHFAGDHLTTLPTLYHMLEG